jgi:DNA-binding transcriptional LysR family regulator
MDRFQEMRVFTAVVEAGSFVGASATVGLSKAAVSRYVADLEARLGVRLLHRTTRKLSLTEEGETFYVRCKSLLAEVDEAEAEITARAGEARGELRVNVPVTFGLLYLAPLWGGFMQRNPRVTLDVTLADRMVDIVEEGYDMAVRIGQLESSSLVSRRLATTRMILCASPRYLEQHGWPEHPEQLADHAVLAYTLLAMGEQWAFDGPAGRVTVRVSPRLTSNSGDTCRAAALAHRGLVLQPSFLVGEDLRRGDLVEVLPEYRSVEFGIHAVYASRKHVSPKVRVLIDYLVEAFATPPWAEPGTASG